MALHRDGGFESSWYSASVALPALRPALQSSVRADVCIVGGGIAGTSAALHLAQRGYRVVLLEAERIGWGASGRSGAQAIFGVAASQEKLTALVGEADARAIWDISLEGLQLMRELIATHGIECDWVSGQLHVAIKARQARELHAWCEELHERYGYRSVRYLDAAEVRAQVATRRYVAGLVDDNGGHLHPLKYVLGLAAAAERAGCHIYEGSRAVQLHSPREARGTVRIATSGGEVVCDHALLAGNAWLGGLAPRLQRRILGVGTYIVATQPLGAPRAAALIRDDVAVTDINWVLDYFRRSSDHRLLFGGRVSYSGMDARDTARATRARMVKVFPQLADVAIEYAWGGFVDITRNRAPDFGRLAPNVFYLQGFSGHGIVLAGIAGKLVAEAVAGSAGRFDVFARIPHREFPGGTLLRRPALVLAMLWYRLRDLL